MNHTETVRIPPAAEEPLDISFSGPLLDQLVRHFARLGDAFRGYAPAAKREIYVLSHPEHAKHVLVTRHQNYTKGIGIERVAMLLGTGLMVSEGELWRRQRKVIQRGFHSRLIARLVRNMADVTLQLRDTWLARARRREPIDLTQDVSEATLRIMLRTVIGNDLERITEEHRGNPFALLTDDPERNLAFAVKFRSLARLIGEALDRRHRQSGGGESGGGGDLLSIMMDSDDTDPRESMPDQQLVDEILTLIVAGHETTASALSWMWYLLSQHPGALERLHQEVDRGRQDVANLRLEEWPFTRQVIEETLRLYPPGWLLTRRAIQSDVIAGYSVPAGTDVFISPYLVHRHPQFWHEAERFEPERFAPSSQQERDRFAYIPFGLGPRTCIGEHFAMVEMLVHTVLLAREIHLEFVPQPPVEPEAGVNLRTRHHLTMMPIARHP
ncbi:MAG: cytochrome P450 [Gemmatimonadales bacterium]